MVYLGPSRGCQPCRKSHVKCDEGRPSCDRCIKRKQPSNCVYRDTVISKHQIVIHGKQTTNQRPAVIRKSTASSSSPALTGTNPSRASSATLELSPFFSATDDAELQANSFFFNNYAKLPRDPRTNIFLDHLIPLWERASEGSALKQALSAVAASVAELWRLHRSGKGIAATLYNQSVASLRRELENPDQLGTYELLGTVFLLDFYESSRNRYLHIPDSDIHLNAAMSIIRARGTATLRSEASKRLFIAIRARYILTNFQSRRRIILEDDMMLENVGELDIPGVQLDFIIADLANTLHGAKSLVDVGLAPAAGSGTAFVGGIAASGPEASDDEMSFEGLLDQLLQLHTRLSTWYANLPPAWEPYRLPDIDDLHESIREAGVYNSLCDVYSSTAVGHAQNGWRSTMICVLRIIKHCLRHLDPDSPLKQSMSIKHIDSEIQSLADDICASVPFFLGNRTGASYPFDHNEYPPVPAYVRDAAECVDSFGYQAEMTDESHIHAAASLGGWFVLSSLVIVMSYAQPFAPKQLINTTLKPEPIGLRQGQLMWIVQQVLRVHDIYKLSLPPGIGGT